MEGVYEFANWSAMISFSKLQPSSRLLKPLASKRFWLWLHFG